MKKIKILDIGCGTGQNLNKLSKKGEYYGIDISQNNIEQNKKIFPEFNFDTIDITKKTKFSNSFFDKIYCFDVLEHVDDIDSTLSEIYRIINKTKGKLIVKVPSYFSESIFLKLNPQYNIQVGHKRQLKEKEWIKKIENHGFFLYYKKYQKFNDFLYLTYKFYRNKKIINEMGEFNEGILSKKDELNSKIWLKNNKFINELYSPLFGKSLHLEFKTNLCKIKKNKKIKTIDQIINKNEILKKENQEIKKQLNKIQSSKTYKLWQKYNKFKKILINN